MQQKSERLKRLCILCMKLSRHLLRENGANKRYAVRFVPLLQKNLDYGIRCTDTLREIFANNAMMLDLVTDAHVSRFIELIHENGREARFIEFLQVLTACNGKAVRPNQWRICRLLLEEAPELLIKLELKVDPYGEGEPHVVAHGDPAYFPAFIETGEMELAEWLQKTKPSTRAYFEHCIELCAMLVNGRNLKNAPCVQRLLPYELVEAAITNKVLNDRYLPVVSDFIEVAMHLYVDHEPHELMTRVKVVRIWANIDKAAESGKLSSRLTTKLRLDWSRFDNLKAHLLAYISRFHHQTGTQVVENRMVLLLLQCCYHLLRCGFYKSAEVVTIIPTLVAVLDGTSDKVGLWGEKEDPLERFKQRDGVKCSTLVIMECKSEVCKILSLICTMRVDIRLSKLLRQYKLEYESGKWGETQTDVKAASWSAAGKSAGGGIKKMLGGAVGKIGAAAGSTLSAVKERGEEAARGLASAGRRRKSAGYVQLLEKHAGSVITAHGHGKEAFQQRKAVYEHLFELLSLEVDLTGDGQSNLVETLMDLSCARPPTEPPLRATALLPAPCTAQDR